MGKPTGIGDPMPSGAAGPRPSVVYPRPGQPLEVLILSDSWWGCDCHWIPPTESHPARSVLCELPDGCHWCDQHRPFKWHGYIPVVLVNRMSLAVLSSTKTGMLSILDATGHPASLRGSMLVITRATSHPSSVARAEASQKTWRQPVPKAFDPLGSLEGIYGANAVDRWRARIANGGRLS